MGFIFSFEQSFPDSLQTIRDFWKMFQLFKLEAMLVTDDYKGPRKLAKEICAVILTARKS